MVKRSRTKSASVRSVKRKVTPNSKVVIMRNPKYTAPAGVQVVLRYSHRADLDTAIASLNTTVLRGAGAFDPDFAIGGHQPLGFDQWSALYQRYRVVSCKITADFLSEAIDTPFDGCIPFVCATETSSAFTFPDTYMEQPYSKAGIMLRHSGISSTRITMNVKTADFEGDSGALFDKDYTADIGGLPTRDWFYHVGAVNSDPSALTLDCKVHCILEYTIRFYDREDLLQS